MQVNAERIEKDFTHIAQFGHLENGGVTRLAFSQEDLKAREYLKQVMEELKLEVTIDAFGNLGHIHSIMTSTTYHFFISQLGILGFPF